MTTYANNPIKQSVRRDLGCKRKFILGIRSLRSALKISILEHRVGDTD